MRAKKIRANGFLTVKNSSNSESDDQKILGVHCKNRIRISRTLCQNLWAISVVDSGQDLKEFRQPSPLVALDPKPLDSKFHAILRVSEGGLKNLDFDLWREPRKSIEISMFFISDRNGALIRIFLDRIHIIHWEVIHLEPQEVNWRNQFSTTIQNLWFSSLEKQLMLIITQQSTVQLGLDGAKHNDSSTYMQNRSLESIHANRFIFFTYFIPMFCII